ncbi:EAL domain-containing protein [Bacillus lacus]|uniref:EAL domain-containing protein n=1 Tax=Metabacillus lacus TaxID=1983721 RepID=A0A7X2J1V4_9BACI|nr:GGDEF and EAL domain-containing protein [Metabacillus lacus]MRX73779.1 EAL domain-containing protein [Metabacillus lacus]
MNSWLQHLHESIGDEEHQKHIKETILPILLKHIKDFVFLMRVEQNPLQFSYIFVNDEGAKHARLPASYEGMSLHDLLPKDAADHLHNKYQQVMRTGQSLSFQDQVEIGKGNYVIGESRLSPIKDDNSQIKYIISVTRDITQLANEQQQLKESQQRYKSLVDHNLDAIFTLANDGTILAVNPSAKKLTGLSERQLISKKLQTFFSEKEERVLKMFEQTLKGAAAEEEISFASHGEVTLHCKTIPVFLQDSVSGLFFICRDVTEKVRQDQRIKHMAYYDTLTGLKNRSALKKDAHEMIQNQKEHSFALLFIDLDRFKMLNDTMGHNVGDHLLIEVGNRFRQLDYSSFDVYRHGGDEFIILLNNASEDEAEAGASALLGLFHDPIDLNGLDYYISPSIGISIFPKHGSTLDELLISADTALYEVKKRGRGDYQLFAERMKSDTGNVLLIETGLRRAIENRELRLAYQPQIDLRSREPISFEVLVRWEPANLPAISPAEFIPVAEESGLIIPLGEWILEEAMKQLYTWKQEGLPEAVLAINLSAKQFMQPYLVEMIQSLMLTYEVQPAQIELEITEGALTNPDEAYEMIRRLKDLGLSISIDDFGTGYSSLTYLKRFPIDSLKIDQSFVKDLLLDEQNRAITTTILHLAQSLGLRVVAEGVETKEQLLFLEENGCQIGQGFYFDSPLSASEIQQTYLRKKEYK